MSTVYVSIGNSDDQLTQAEWSDYVRHVDQTIRSFAFNIYGFWVSPSTEPYQNACWGFEIEFSRQDLKRSLQLLADMFRQESIVWVYARNTEFLPPLTKTPSLTSLPYGMVDVTDEDADKQDGKSDDITKQDIDAVR